MLDVWFYSAELTRIMSLGWPGYMIQLLAAYIYGYFSSLEVKSGLFLLLLSTLVNLNEYIAGALVAVNVTLLGSRKKKFNNEEFIENFV